MKRSADPKYRAWRDAVISRDGNACAECGKKERGLHAHHVKPWAKYPELRYEVENGKTLCRKCHHSVHRWMSRSSTAERRYSADPSLNLFFDSLCMESLEQRVLEDAHFAQVVEDIINREVGCPLYEMESKTQTLYNWRMFFAEPHLGIVSEITEDIARLFDA